MQLLVLRLITAQVACSIKLGATTTVRQLTVASSESFTIMLRGFPRITKEAIMPCHVGLGYMKPTGNGLMSMGPNMVGKTTLYYDIPRAVEQGYIGQMGGRVRKTAEWSLLIDIL